MGIVGRDIGFVASAIGTVDAISLATPLLVLSAPSYCFISLHVSISR